MSAILIYVVALLAPATSPTSSVEADLRRIISKLQTQIVELKTMNAFLTQQNKDLLLRIDEAKAQAAKAAVGTLAPGTDDVAIMDQVKPGMTRQEIQAIVGNPPVSEVSESPGGSALTWKFTAMTGSSGDSRLNVGHREVVAQAVVYLNEAGKVTRVVKIRN